MASRTTAPQLRARKTSRGDAPIVMVTAYDAPFARLVDAAGVDAILVGDSVADNVLGYKDTLHVGVADIAHHLGAVSRADPVALVVGDLPWMSYHLEIEEAVRNAATLVRAGARAVKLEGGRVRVPVIRSIVDAEIPVMGHLGLTPQSVHTLGGYKVQGRAIPAADGLRRDAEAIVAAGVFSIVLEGVPDVLARRITEEVEVPTIGIGAGAGCDGQVLVLHDLLGLADGTPAKYVRRYADLSTLVTEAVAAFGADVREGRFPSDAETYHGSAELISALGE